MLLKCRFLSKISINDLEKCKKIGDLERICPFMVHAKRTLYMDLGDRRIKTFSSLNGNSKNLIRYS